MILNMACPECGEPLESQRGTNKPLDFDMIGNDEQGRTLDQHIHILMKEKLICSNSHKWDMRDDFHISRKG